MEQVRAEMEAGTDPSNERVQALARRWTELINEFTGGNHGIERSVGGMRRQEAEIYGIETAPVREMMGYIHEALAASKRGREAGGP